MTRMSTGPNTHRTKHPELAFGKLPGPRPLSLPSPTNSSSAHSRAHSSIEGGGARTHDLRIKSLFRGLRHADQGLQQTPESFGISGVFACSGSGRIVLAQPWLWRDDGGTE